MKRLTGKQLRERLGIINSHDYLMVSGAAVSVMVCYSPEQPGRGYRPAAWQVLRPGYKTDPDAHWQWWGNKTFTLHGREDRESKRLEAIEWASERYHYGEWVKANVESRQTFWVPKPIAEAVARAYEAGEPKLR